MFDFSCKGNNVLFHAFIVFKQNCNFVFRFFGNYVYGCILCCTIIRTVVVGKWNCCVLTLCLPFSSCSQIIDPHHLSSKQVFKVLYVLFLFLFNFWNCTPLALVKLKTLGLYTFCLSSGTYCTFEYFMHVSPRTVQRCLDSSLGARSNTSKGDWGWGISSLWPSQRVQG